MCSTCDGAGSVLFAVQATIEYQPVKKEVGNSVPSLWNFPNGTITESDWTLVHLSPGASIPEELRDHLDEALTRELESRSESEQLRKLEVMVLQATRVDRVGEEDTHPAYIVGPSRKISAKKSRSGKRIAALVSVLTLVAAGVAAAIALSNAPAAVIGL